MERFLFRSGEVLRASKLQAFGDSILQEFALVHAKFNSAVGHRHTGLPGDAPKLDGSSIAAKAITPQNIVDLTPDDLAPRHPTGDLQVLLDGMAAALRVIKGAAWTAGAPSLTEAGGSVVGLTLAYLAANGLFSGVNRSVSGLLTFSRPSGQPPFAVGAGNTATVANLSADLLDGYDSTAFPRKAENAAISGSWTFGGAVTVNNTASVQELQTKVGTAAGGHSHLQLWNGSLRWGIGLQGDEGTGNDGSDFSVWRYTNGGGYLAKALNISRSSGLGTFYGDWHATDGAGGVQLRKEGGIEILKSNTPYIDFKDAAGEDYDVRLLKRDGENTVEALGNLGATGALISRAIRNGGDPNRVVFLSLRNADNQRRIEIGLQGPETGGHGGSNLKVWRYNDLDGYLGEALTIVRSSGVVIAHTHLDVVGTAYAANLFTDSGTDAAGKRHLTLGSASGYNRFALGLQNDETGNNAGGDLKLWRYADNGVSLGEVLSVQRSSGNVFVNNALTVGGTVSGSTFQSNAGTHPGGYAHLQLWNGSIRWGVGLQGSEGTGNDGSDFSVWRYKNDGGYLARALSISRSSGLGTFYGDWYATDGAGGVQLRAEGGIEILKSNTPYIDFKDAAGEDYDVRLAKRDGQNTLDLLGSLALTGNLTVGKPDGYTSLILFPAQANDPGYIQHWENNNSAVMRFVNSDDPAAPEDYFEWGADNAARNSFTPRMRLYNRGELAVYGDGVVSAKKLVLDGQEAWQNGTVTVDMYPQPGVAGGNQNSPNGVYIKNPGKTFQLFTGTPVGSFTGEDNIQVYFRRVPFQPVSNRTNVTVTTVNNSTSAADVVYQVTSAVAAVPNDDGTFDVYLWLYRQRLSGNDANAGFHILLTGLYV